MMVQQHIYTLSDYITRVAEQHDTVGINEWKKARDQMSKRQAMRETDS